MNEQKKVHITIFQAPFASLIERAPKSLCKKE